LLPLLGRTSGGAWRSDRRAQPSEDPAVLGGDGAVGVAPPERQPGLPCGYWSMTAPLAVRGAEEGCCSC